MGKTSTNRDSATSASGVRHLFAAASISLIAFGVYQLNGDFCAYDDSWPNVNLARLILRDGQLTFRPQDIPQLFIWEVYKGDRAVPAQIDWYDESMATAEREGWLRVAGPDDVPLRIPEPDRYANAFGIGAAVAALPAVAIADRCVNSLADRPDLMWRIGKWVASAWAAGSVGLMFLIVRRAASTPLAWLVAAAYGLATCLFSVSSQALWQHAPNQFMLALGTYAFFRAAERWSWAALAGAAYGAAVWCRPTSLLIVIAVGGYLLLVSRKQFLAFLLAGLPLGILTVVYNLAVFGVVLAVGQSQGQAAALERTGSPEMFQTPIWLGAAGTLFSPSRGLFVFSPFLLFTLLGVWRCWRQPEYARWRPLSIGILGVWCIQFQFFDWWGGWSFAYRHLVDTVTLLILFLLPAFSWIFAHPASKWTFWSLLSYSIVVQVLGAWCFDISGWNAREGFWLRTHAGDARLLIKDPALSDNWPPPPGSEIEVVDMDVDFPPYRHRLWSFRDSQLAYYATHTAQARARRHFLVTRSLRSVDARRADTQAQIGEAWCQLGDFERAMQAFAMALKLNPHHQAATLGEARAAAALGHAEAAVARHQEVLKRDRNELSVLISWALLQAALDSPADAIATLRQARDIHPIYARDTFRRLNNLWQQQVANRLPVTSRQALANVADQCTADWFYDPRVEEVASAVAAPATSPPPSNNP